MENVKERKTILIVDDTPGNIQILVEVLKNEYTTIVAVNGEKALRLAAKEPLPDLILLDVMMPGMDGYEVCTKLKIDEKTRDIPIIFVTAKADVEDELKGFELGAVDYITKPVSPPIVKARVRTHLALKEAKERLARQNEELREAARLREDVDNIARHDLKAPLNSIIGLPQIMMQEGIITGEYAEHLKTIEESGYRMLRMINLSLDLFKMERGIYRFEPASVDVLKMIRKIFSENKAFASSKNIDFRVTLQDYLPHEHEKFLLQGEELLCYSMLSNLIKNAIEASPSGKTVSADLSSDEQGHINIHNSGAVPEKIRSTFFEKYATAGKSGGTGLGTYSAMLIAKTQGGSIRMETSEDQGTTITVTLSLGNEEEGRSQTKRPVGPAQKYHQMLTTLEQIDEKKILLVDDDPFNLKVLEKHLSHPKLILDFAENGKAAYEKCIETSYDIVFMDMEMPVMDGLEAARTIRDMESSEGRGSIPIIALSGHDDDTAKQKCIEAGFTGYMMKPAKQEDLIKEVFQTNSKDAVSEEHLPAPPYFAKKVVKAREEIEEADYLVRIDPDLEELMPSFLIKKKTDISELQTAFDNNDFEEVRRLGHKLKGGLSVYGFKTMSEICANIENSAKIRSKGEIKEQIDRLNVFIKNVRIEYTKGS